MSKRSPIFRHPVVQCPRCALELNGSVQVTGTPAAPTHGDITICGRCLAVLRFQFSRAVPPLLEAVPLSRREVALLSVPFRRELEAALAAVRAANA